MASAVASLLVALFFIGLASQANGRDLSLQLRQWRQPLAVDDSCNWCTIDGTSTEYRCCGGTCATSASYDCAGGQAYDLEGNLLTSGGGNDGQPVPTSSTTVPDYLLPSGECNYIDGFTTCYDSSGVTSFCCRNDCPSTDVGVLSSVCKGSAKPTVRTINFQARVPVSSCPPTAAEVAAATSAAASALGLPLSAVTVVSVQCLSSRRRLLQRVGQDPVKAPGRQLLQSFTIIVEFSVTDTTLTEGEAIAKVGGSTGWTTGPVGAGPYGR